MLQHHQTTILQVVSYLSPGLDDLYHALATYVGEQLGLPVRFSAGESLEDFSLGKAHMGFLSGTILAQMERLPACPIELVAAPVLQDARFRGTPLSFSEVIVHNESPYTTFHDLRGSVWAYAETPFYSAYGLLRQRLMQRALPVDYFRWAVATGSQRQSLQAILNGHADATAVDSHLLALMQQKEPELLTTLRTIDTFGPPQVFPVVLARTLPRSLQHTIQETLLTMHQTSTGAQLLHSGQLARFLPLGHAGKNHVLPFSSSTPSFVNP